MSGFDWDPFKARANEAKHGISFVQASAVFADQGKVDAPDLRYPDEDGRRVAIGFSVGRLLHVAAVEYGDTIRIISARRATKAERIRYARQNDPR
jgi:hypothetical protein